MEQNFNDKPLWWEITPYEFLEYWNEIRDRFGITLDLIYSDLGEFYNRFPKFDKPHSDYLRSIGFKFDKTNNKDSEHQMSKGNLWIRCVGDGWYTVFDLENRKHYKCDGFDGLKEFLNDHK